jgi:2-methylcitrate dehydratase
MGMHFKLGLYEHQSAGAIQGLIELLSGCPRLLTEPDEITKLRVAIYEPAFSIIGDAAKRDPRTRQSADHSLVYIIATLLRKAIEKQAAGWSELMLLPADYELSALHDWHTRRLMRRIEFVHGGAEYDALYPEGIPTRVEIEHERFGRFSSGLIQFPAGHARCEHIPWQPWLREKFYRLARLGGVEASSLEEKLLHLGNKSADDVYALYW